MANTYFAQFPDISVVHNIGSIDTKIKQNTNQIKAVTRRYHHLTLSAKNKKITTPKLKTPNIAGKHPRFIFSSYP